MEPKTIIDSDSDSLEWESWIEEEEWIDDWDGSLDEFHSYDEDYFDGEGFPGNFGNKD